MRSLLESFNKICFIANTSNNVIFIQKEKYSLIFMFLLIKFNFLTVTNVLDLIVNNKKCPHYTCKKNYTGTNAKIVLKTYSSTRRVLYIQLKKINRLKRNTSKLTYFLFLTKKGILCTNTYNMFLLPNLVKTKIWQPRIIFPKYALKLKIQTGVLLGSIIIN